MLKEERASIAKLQSELVSQARLFPPAGFSSFRINTQKEGLEDCLYRFGSGLCNIYVMSRARTRQHNAKNKPVHTCLAVYES